jgi:tRNA(Arg) A34 adenosine deaminase TadA
MALVVALSAENVRRKTGGPFGAAVFDMDDGRIVSAGVNLVVSANCSVLHAEIVALALAQSRLEHYDLATVGSRRYALVTSTEPCAMCLGAIPWSGVCVVVCGARDEDARHAGFDEGAKPADWVRQLKRRGITVKQDVLRTEAATVLANYAAGGGIIYNGRGW